MRSAVVLNPRAVCAIVDGRVKERMAFAENTREAIVTVFEGLGERAEVRWSLKLERRVLRRQVCVRVERSR